MTGLGFFDKFNGIVEFPEPSDVSHRISILEYQSIKRRDHRREFASVFMDTNAITHQNHLFFRNINTPVTDNENETPMVIKKACGVC